ncbi:Dolichyl-phosphate-mannose-protein mannosyltransferase [Halanaerobium congolense]|jgi:hypothetical protein|uniref:Dolichyl-phosphate-mannose-protein mannosyltransferase n=1 Tax=Halanaerobium congolense TaxID=54121 RepID=A0A1M7PI92_9FIRM|nr:tripartite tricarboxylate transporter TctB family protein [Halanaerobium congolense]PTX16041.1 dolichyl-phosphate-mannose-protein mannosyltransferase [Halanaerobium congolense]SDF72643.1 Dolichyl-phosphate-mannose-protein mannosyltransferase [Halanaerobium congolense]SDH01888.1 Dolichyl-phosphate-mannose-protein mannosyltransferase [Halanaerobium congolense]SET06125.1 Dolichyl-phosphate-mannose-protein mannosyltransferase [Halanaerobium congolense]SFP46670.1 Dolichyl-phosphate-mannose-prote
MLKKDGAYNTDLIGGAIMVLSAALFYQQIGNFTTFGLIFPRAIIIILLALGIGLLIKSKLNPYYAEIFEMEEMSKMLLIAGIGLGWVLLLKPVGFAVTSFFAVSLGIYSLEEERTKKTLLKDFIIGGCEVAFFYLIFSRLLLVPLPQGILF